MKDRLWGMNVLSEIFKNYGIYCIGVGDRLADEDEITLTLALYRSDEQRNFDSRMTGEMIFHASSGMQMHVCILYPGSGCGVLVEDGVIAYAEDGPNGFAEENGRGMTGKNASVYVQQEETLLVIWQQEPKTIARDHLNQVIRRMRGLNRAFC